MKWGSVNRLVSSSGFTADALALAEFYGIQAITPGQATPEFIGQVVANWDTATLVDRLELRVGKDLQYIRMNGTIVGFLIGGLLYAVLDTLFGQTIF